LRMTLNRHPLALLRGYLGTRGFMAADRLNQFPDGRLARAAGIVTVRQRPGTAHGTIFVTLEDETGPVNVIVWPSLVDTQRKELLGSSLLGVYGIWQSQQGVRSLVAKRLVDLSGLLGKLNTESRNFH
jgi:error-prone DNA polymerase